MRAAVATGQGVVSAHRLSELGIPGRVVAQWCRSGLLVPVRRGVYTTRELWDSWDAYVARPMARIRAAHLTLRIPHVFSHDSAAILHGVRLLRPQDSAVHITHGNVRGSRSRFGIEHHGAVVNPSRRGRVRGLDVLDVPRTVTDLAREHGYLSGLVAADGALHQGWGRSHLGAAAEEMAGWPFSITVRAVVGDADGGSESVGETLMRDLVIGVLGHEAETQFPVLTRRGVRWCDLRVGRHLFEFDGRIKYQSSEDGGVADRELEQVLWDERRREVDVTDEGFGMTRLTYADHWGEARALTERRVRRDYDDTTRRYGTELTPHQAELAARLRGRRPTG